jgi:Domain of unknown function (DUF1877)
MAMATYLQIVSELELAKLRRQPTWINKVDKSGTYMTYYPCSLNYFLVGDSYPGGSRKRPLEGLLFGFGHVDCETLENGNFGVVDPAEVELVLAALAAVDVDAFRARIDGADESDLEDDEVDDYEMLLEDEGDPADILVAELESLVEFYKTAARSHGAIVSYTT